MNGRILRYFVLVLLASLVSCSDRVLPADIILHSGKIYTADATQPWAEAVAVKGDRVLAVGTSIEILAFAGPDTESIDLAGRIVIPGLNDSHVHTSARLPSRDLDLAENPSLNEVLVAVSTAVEETPPGTWLRGAIAWECFR